MSRGQGPLLVIGREWTVGQAAQHPSPGLPLAAAGPVLLVWQGQDGGRPVATLGPISTFILYFWSMKSTFNKGI